MAPPQSALAGDERVETRYVLPGLLLFGTNTFHAA